MSDEHIIKNQPPTEFTSNSELLFNNQHNPSIQLKKTLSHLKESNQRNMFNTDSYRFFYVS